MSVATYQPPQPPAVRTPPHHGVIPQWGTDHPQCSRTIVALPAARTVPPKPQPAVKKSLWSRLKRFRANSEVIEGLVFATFMFGSPLLFIVYALFYAN